MNDTIETAARLLHTADESALFSPERRFLPNRERLITLLKEIRRAIFPGFFDGDGTPCTESAEMAALLERIRALLREQIAVAFEGKRQDEAERIASLVIAALPEMQTLLLCDVEAGYEGDPAAKSLAEIVVSYPGLYAIFVYRIAHLLYAEQVPLIPRMMTEYAHSRTGIDIHPGAKIGRYFFIDHGTGVVIGETTEIGDYVKLYQGVTLGALSTRSGQALSGVKRHPTLGSHVTVYANSTVLGGETVIGDGAIIGGNAFITKSVPENTKVSVKNPEMIFKTPQNSSGSWEI